MASKFKASGVSKEDILSTLNNFEPALENKENESLNLGRVNNYNPDQDGQGESWDFLEAQAELSSPPPASLSHSYSLEWDVLFSKPDKMMQKLKEKATAGDLRSSRFRSVIWKLFLEVLPPQLDKWVEKTRESRAKFEELKNKLIVNPRKAVDSVNLKLHNPLSQDEESPWNKFFQDNELRLTIKQDVIRTFPEVEFFRGSGLIEMMIDILFCFSREHATNSYKQGMHELLAPLIFVLHCDHQAFSHACEIESVLDIMKEVMDPAFLEHDAYSMFCQVMETVEPWYLSREFYPKSGSMRSLEIINATPFARSNDLNPSSAIVTKLTRIQDYVLKKLDPELHQHLERLEIVPQIYGIRWLRLLFGREFPMQDILMLWDAIFGDGIGFDLVDYIFVAMLIYIRKDLITSDYTTCLTTLMKFPPVADVHYFVVMALYIREPSQYVKPPNYFHQGGVSIMSSNDSIGGYDNVGHYNNRGNSSKKSGGGMSSHRGGIPGQKRQGPTLGGFSSFSRKFSRPRTLSVHRPAEKNMPKSSSEPMNLQTEISPEEPDHPLGSTVSLSQVEESMLHHGPSASSLARMEASTARSAQSSPGVRHGSHIFPLTPEDAPESPTKFGTNKSKKKQKKMTPVEKGWQDQVIRLQGNLNDKETMCRYCASKLDVHIETLQQDLSRRKLDIGDELMVSLAGIKLVRDILNGTLKFNQTMGDETEEFAINDSYYEKEGYSNVDNSKASSECMSPESDILMGAGGGGGGLSETSSTHYGKASDFYISSEDVSPIVHEQGYNNGLRGNIPGIPAEQRRLNDPFYHPDPLDIREEFGFSSGKNDNHMNKERRASYNGSSSSSYNNNNATYSSSTIQSDSTTKNTASSSSSSSQKAVTNPTQNQQATSSSNDATNPSQLTSRIRNIFKSTSQKSSSTSSSSVAPQQRNVSSSNSHSNSGGEKIIEDYTTDAYPKSTVQAIQPESYPHPHMDNPQRSYGEFALPPPPPSSSSSSSSTNHNRPEYARNRSRSNVECSTNLSRHHQAFSKSEEYPTSYHHNPHHHHHHPHNRRGSKGSVGSNGSNSDFVIVGSGGGEAGGWRDGWSSSGDETNRSSSSPRMMRHKSRSQPINPLYSLKYDEGMDC